MKKINFFLTCMLISLAAGAQDYLINFTGSGATSNVTNVKVENLTQGTTLTLNGNDILHLVGNVGVKSESNIINNFHVFPNPMLGSSNLEFSSEKSLNVCISIYSINGKLIFNLETQCYQGNNIFEISGLGKGHYIVDISSSEFKYSTNLISMSENSTNPNITIKYNINKQILKNLHEAKNIVQMQYNDGECLLIKGQTGSYTTVKTLIPTQNSTLCFYFVPCSDADGNNYSVVDIGSQTWMAENLKTTKFNDGSLIPHVMDNNAWSNLTTPGYCWYNNSPVLYGGIYGALYNWHAAITGILCPSGWHVPSYSEVEVLENYLIANGYTYGYSYGDIAKSMAATSYWKTSGGNGTIGNDLSLNNKSGFSALPGGGRGYNGLFDYDLKDGFWWCITNYSASFASGFNLTYYDDCLNIVYDDYYKSNGFSIRCVAD